MTDYSGLVERLRKPIWTGDITAYDPVRTEAAAAIEAQRERIARLEGALREAFATFDNYRLWHSSGFAPQSKQMASERLRQWEAAARAALWEKS